jgi:hypothetical protein
MPDFFLSYSRSDKRLAAELVKTCAEAGCEFWWDSRLLPGVFFRSVVNRRIESARAVVALWTIRSAISPWVVSEAEHGHQLMKLLNVCGPDFPHERIPKPFSVYETLDWPDLQTLPQILRLGYFGLHVEPDQTWADVRPAASDIPFLEILDELYFHHAFVVRGDRETLEKYLKRFPSGRHVAKAAKQLAELSANGSNQLAVSPRDLSDSEHRILELLQGVRHDGQPFWAYVAVVPSQYYAYTSAKATGEINLDDFSKWGELSSAGIGDWPTHADNLFTAQKYNIPISTLMNGPSIAAAGGQQ